MNVGLLGNVAVPIGPIGPIELRKTRPAMGEIVDLERYRKLRRRREAEAKEAKHGPAPDGGKAEGPSSPPAVKRAEPRRNGPESAAEASSDDPKTD